MIVPILVITAAALIIVLSFYITGRKRRKNREQEFKAAAILLKERQLRNAIDMNPLVSQQREQMILIVSWKDDEKRKYIFDPVSGVRIGRDRETNQICVPEGTVSQRQCIIFSNGNSLYVKDLNSANGTYLKRGFTTYKVQDCQLCKEKDRIIVGGISFKIQTFWVDSMYL